MAATRDFGRRIVGHGNLRVVDFRAILSKASKQSNLLCEASLSTKIPEQGWVNFICAQMPELAIAVVSSGA